MPQTPSPLKSSQAPLRWVGIDVSQTHLDIAFEGHSAVKRFEYTQEGMDAMCQAFHSHGTVRVVLEATGAYHQKLVDTLHQRGITLCLINPKRLRDFAKATGVLAKTDALDAKVLVQFAKALTPDITPAKTALQQQLQALTRRRKQLVSMRSEEKQRRKQCHHQGNQQHIDRHIEWLSDEIADLDKEIEKTIEQDDTAAAQDDQLRTVPGVGPAVSSILLAELPELGTVSSKKLCALAGLAPFNHDSGMRRGKRAIRAGRPAVRTILYCAALVACRHNPPLNAFYNRLLLRGKSKKSALIATARKLLCFLNAIAKSHAEWNFEPSKR